MGRRVAIWVPMGNELDEVVCCYSAIEWVREVAAVGCAKMFEVFKFLACWFG